MYNLSSESKTRTPSVSLDTIRGKFVLKCDEAAEMVALIEELMDGLRQRSVYALALQDVNKPCKCAHCAQNRTAGLNTCTHIMFIHTRDAQKTHMHMCLPRSFYR